MREKALHFSSYSQQQLLPLVWKTGSIHSVFGVLYACELLPRLEENEIEKAKKKYRKQTESMQKLQMQNYAAHHEHYLFQ